MSFRLCKGLDIVWSDCVPTLPHRPAVLSTWALYSSSALIDFPTSFLPIHRQCSSVTELVSYAKQSRLCTLLRVSSRTAFPPSYRSCIHFCLSKFGSDSKWIGFQLDRIPNGERSLSNFYLGRHDSNLKIISQIVKMYEDEGRDTGDFYLDVLHPSFSPFPAYLPLPFFFTS